MNSLLLVALLMAAAGLQEDPRRFSTQVVVTPERGEAPRSAVPVAITVLDAAAIQALPAAHMAEIMRVIAGFATARPEFHAGRPIVSARGFFGGGEAEYLVLLVDGVPVGDVESGLIDWSAAPVSSIVRLEASRGPGSSMYGDSAVGGVVQILTHRAATGGQLTLGGGSFSTFMGDGSYEWRRPGVSASAAGVVRTTDGAYAQAAARQAGGVVSLDGRAGAFTWGWNARVNVQDRDDPGAVAREGNPPPEASPYRFDTTGRIAGASALTVGHDAPRLRTQVRMYAGARDEDAIRTILLVPEFGERYARHLSTFAIGGTLDVEHRVDVARPVLLRFGLDLSRESLDSTYRDVDPEGTIGGVADAADGRRLRTGAFVSSAWDAANRVRLTGALRWDGVDDAGFGDPASEPSTDAWSPRAGIAVQLNGTGTLTLFGQVSRAFKMPTLDQLFDRRPFPDFMGGALTISNPLLQPQRATSAEAGISGAGRLAWSAVVYRTGVTNEIDFDVRTFSYANIGRSRHTGVEAEAEGRWWSRVRPSVSYSLTRTIDRDTGAQLKNVARHLTSGAMDIDVWWKVSANARYTRASGAYLDDENTFPIDGASRLDIRVRRPLGRHAAFVDVTNATGDRYEEYGFTLTGFTGQTVPFVYPAAGAAIRAGVTWKF